MNNRARFLVPRACVLLLSVGILLPGCAEGPLWQTGHMVPWARNQWEQENDLAATLQRRKRELNQMLQQASTDAQIDQAASRLGDIAQRDPVTLVRLHAVSLLGKMDHPAAIEHLKKTARDPDSKIRIAAVESWQGMSPEVAIPQLQEIIGSDTDVDVRLAATRALGSFRDSRATNALSLALTDTNPAIQFRAMKSLERATGEKLGTDVAAWQTYLDSQTSVSVAAGPESINASPRR